MSDHDHAAPQDALVPRDAILPHRHVPDAEPPPFDPEVDADRIRNLRAIVPPYHFPDATRMRITTPEERAAGMPAAVPATDPFDPRAKGGRPKTLDGERQRQICLLLSSGCSRAQAARYIGCGRATIYRTARRDPRFARALEQAEISRQHSQLQNVRRAAEGSWRAAAWLLERFDPQRFQPSRGERYWPKQVVELLQVICDDLIESEAHAIFRDQAKQRAAELIRAVDCPGGIARRLRETKRR